VKRRDVAGRGRGLGRWSRGGQLNWLAAIVSDSQDAILSKGLDGTILSWNPGAERLYGFSAQEAVGRHIGIVVPEDRHGEIEDIIARIRGGEKIEPHETVRRRKDGELVLVSITVSPIYDDDGEVVAASVIARDVTRRFEIERALAESEQHRRSILGGMLRAEEEERSRIATALHDDTVQVMTASLLAMDRAALVARRRGDARVEEALAYARATLEEATERTRRLMFELRPAVLHDHGLAAALRLLADQTAREVGATAHVQGHLARYDTVTEELLYRSAQEALANIRRHASPDTITVALDRRPGWLEIAIQDDGRGFDIVDVQTRPDAAFHFGLETLAERIRAAGGYARITSHPGTGTRVSFALPVVDGVRDADDPSATLSPITTARHGDPRHPSS
jgi:PAS domain S-box-containing protein